MPRKILGKIEEFEAWLARFHVRNPNVDLDKIVNDIMKDLNNAKAAPKVLDRSRRRE